jgi:2,4-dienoyl-CoA reductase-like NADH-dependent reductase (Old Yellow Enzyme family)
MSEVLGSPAHAPTEKLVTLYRRWANGGAGLLITGNVMIDRRRLGEPGNVVVEDERDMKALRAWAAAGTEQNTHLWMQLNHPGKQSPKFLSKETVAPSAVEFGKALSPAFSTPRALEEEEIEDIIQRFATAAGVAKKAGFTGVQIHGAHGYLVSQFLSPHHNRREDMWGGSLENRSRFVLEIYARIRAEVGDDFPIAIKLNSADFQKGGFSEEDSMVVMQMLAEAGIDLIEVSGGTYEAPAMTGDRLKRDASSREGYFLKFVEEARNKISIPLCVTGGFRSPAGMAAAVGDGAADLVGLASTLAIQPEFPQQVLAGEDVTSLVRKLSTGLKTLDKLSMLTVTFYENQLWRMGSGRDPKPGRWAITSVLLTLGRMGRGAFRVRRAK